MRRSALRVELVERLFLTRVLFAFFRAARKRHWAVFVVDGDERAGGWGRARRRFGPHGDERNRSGLAEQREAGTRLVGRGKGDADAFIRRRLRRVEEDDVRPVLADREHHSGFSDGVAKREISAGRRGDQRGGDGAVGVSQDEAVCDFGGRGSVIGGAETRQQESDGRRQGKQREKSGENAVPPFQQLDTGLKVHCEGSRLQEK
jgi:hypothetical protein